MQKILSLILIMIMTTLPMMSVSASVNSCQHSDPQLASSMEVKQQSMDMGSMHDCCATHGVSCDHGGDCDNGQAAYSLVTNAQSTFVDYQASSHLEVIPDLFISKNSESLYRPPISIL